ncbi:MAG: hypothetical protein AL399_04545 [Candidatus [Bacteroides] periocalifornicus]|uniref:Uncharacterized protein n=1 Tax=Candidatus [Bacteroides] periocalifornicus TaxID=1702214 RepID=A0A0Q4AY20_9BACT|nr:MAG: hypothetical protein AL399_04545 [Candidatus [Bacteroides] periocalifornicus]
MPHHLRGLQRAFAVPSPYLRRTSSSASSDFVMKSEHEAAQVRRWYGAGIAHIRRAVCRPACFFIPSRASSTRMVASN